MSWAWQPLLLAAAQLQSATAADGVIEGAGSGKYKERKRRNLSDDEIWIQFESLKSQFSNQPQEQETIPEVTVAQVERVRNKIEQIIPQDDSPLIHRIEVAQRLLDEIEAALIEIEYENEAIEVLLLAA